MLLKANKKSYFVLSFFHNRVDSVQTQQEQEWPCVKSENLWGPSGLYRCIFDLVCVRFETSQLTVITFIFHYTKLAII